AHGNGYADPNILVPQVIESVQVDGGAFNVREGNHSQNLSATYGLRSLLDPSVTLTGDYRDLTSFLDGALKGPVNAPGLRCKRPTATVFWTGSNTVSNTKSTAFASFTLASIS